MEDGGGVVRCCEGPIAIPPPPPPPPPLAGTLGSFVVAGASGNWPDLEGEAVELGALPPPRPPELATFALLLLELLAASCFFFELLNLTLPESVSFNFPNSFVIGFSMVNPLVITRGKVWSFLQLPLCSKTVQVQTAEQRQ